MRTILFYLLFQFTVSLAAQPVSLQKTWIGEDLEFIRIDSQWAYIELFGVFPEQLKYKLAGDTLRLYRQGTRYRDSYKTVITENYDFLVVKFTGTALELEALNKNALELTGLQKQLLLKDRNSIQQKKVTLEGIKFDHGPCLGTCPAMTLEITNHNQLRFIGGEHAVKQGFYTATIPDSLVNRMEQLVGELEIDRLKTWQQTVSDAPRSVLEFHYDNKTKTIRNYFLPAITHELIRFMLELPGKVSLVPAAAAFKIEFADKE